MSRSLKKGFSLVELMTTLAVTAVVITGVVATFNKITKSTDNAAKAVNLTNSARGLASILASDFANAGRGFSDLISLDIRFRFDPDFYAFPGGKEVDLNMYAITDLAYDDANEISEITLHWFDYDVREAPSFIFQPSAAEVASGNWGNGQTTFTGGRLYTNDTDKLEELAQGDMLLLYNLAPMVSSGDATRTPWYSHGTRNQGLILQVASTANYTENPTMETNTHLGMAGYIEVTFSDGPIFSNTIDSEFANVMDDETSSIKTYMVSTTDIRTKGYSLPETVWVARRLGGPDDFNRVTYEVVQGDGTNVLVRRYNGDPEIVATDVERFSVSLGLDVHPTELADMEFMDPTEVDGLVSRLDGDLWTKGKNVDSRFDSLSDEEFKIAIGRHAMQVEVDFQQLGAEDKAENETTNPDGSTGTYRKRRGFVQQYRLRNISPPITNN